MQYTHVQVNVTFYSSGNCLAETKSYVAFADSPLSPNFTDHTAPNNTNTCGSTLQMNFDPDDSGGGVVVTLLAPWINTTVVIRRHAQPDLLAVTLQVPGHLAFESDGLCRGCPAHTHFDIVNYSTITLGGGCGDVSNNALYHCWGFTNSIPEFSDVINITYGEICRYNLLRANSSNYGMLSFQKAVIEDAKLLDNHGNVPPRNFDLIEPRGSDGAGTINNSCNPPLPIDTTAHTTTTTTVTSTEDSTGHDGSYRAITPQHSASTDSVTTPRSNTLGISSAIYGHQRQVLTRLLTLSLLSVFLSRLLFR